MWTSRSASRSSIWRGSVQTWLVTRAASKSARCMNAPKLRPMPIGSTIVNRTMPGGRLVRSRNIEAWSTAERRGPALGGGLDQQVGRGGKRPQGGELELAGDAVHQPGVGRDSPRQGGKLDRDRAHADDRGDQPGQGAVGPGGVIPGRADLVDGPLHRGELGR